MKFILNILLVGLVQFGFNHIAYAQSSPESTLNAIHSTGIFKIGTEGAYAPFSYHDASGKLTGFDVEIGREIALRMKVTPEFIEGKWDGLIGGLDAGRSDAVMNQIAITPEREKKYSFSQPYVISEAVLITRTNNNDIKTFSDLKGKRSAHTLTNNFAQIARHYGADIISANGFSQEVELVSTGRADATINDKLSYLDYKKHRPDAPVRIVAADTQAAKTAVLLRKNDAELKAAIDKAIMEIKADGAYQKIWDKYFSE
ncbi:amino acid ABC transporter substrate-binding protein [Xenorhabdus szentirmaii]|uniref:Cysteine transport protein (ABC superfamily, peri_bind) n=2 Tax=Xenorhabdus szentirmaii TaxID=290112 RepID=W1J488_9GAMM|nr:MULTISPECIES: amino acid ABC transporter substrate-binding protein [Xenorhabdus]MBD2782682.1 amino acid ABC transporter substrate-binding protein [Xenorhabdus sp. 38]MBD2793856.1 amino acid ABC transporter substrate-binding protein [Xenorhabdus sp. CUL]MBD2801913.1 amino acid ABC transporter substrate-binding protein [Xenorhabdus sp. M]MBD2806671.1 amino acid ABC transporter substrate-binding protein [Xenorhabdus sp. ZM]PHM34054.1 periplasmic solute-binding protein [Xenorhabdus szentirmaii 